MKAISKIEFAKRIGVSTPTLYAWIRKDKDGLSRFVTEEGISPEIFDVEPWSAYKDDRTMQQRTIDDLTGEADRAADRIRELTVERDVLQIKVEALQQTIDLLNGQISAKDQQINALLVSLNMQIKALPEPKVHWWQRRRKKAADESTSTTY